MTMNNPLFEYLIKSGITLALLYSIYWVFLRNEKTLRFNRFYLLFSIFISHILSLFNISGLVGNKIASILQLRFLVALFEKESSGAQTGFNSTQNLTEASSSSIWDYIIYVYLIIALLLLIRVILGLIKIGLMYRNGAKEKCKGYTVVYTYDNIAPFSFFKIIFINRRNSVNEGTDKIILHELAHINQGHSIDTLFAGITAIFHWYNPFVWFTKKSLKETHEYLADEKVIEQGADSEIYSELLLEQASGAEVIDFANCFNHLLIKKRLIMMGRIERGRSAMIKKIVVIPLMLLFMIYLNVQGNVAPENKFNKNTYIREGEKSKSGNNERFNEKISIAPRTPKKKKTNPSLQYAAIKKSTLPQVKIPSGDIVIEEKKPKENTIEIMSSPVKNNKQSFNDVIDIVRTPKNK